MAAGTLVFGDDPQERVFELSGCLGDEFPIGGLEWHGHLDSSTANSDHSLATVNIVNT